MIGRGNIGNEISKGGKAPKLSKVNKSGKLKSGNMKPKGGKSPSR